MHKDTFGYESKLPDNIREVFMWLCQDVASLHNKWSFYIELFSGEENTGLLSELAQASFQIIEESLRDDMTMAICRLSDPAQSGRKHNLSLATLVHRLDERDDLPALLKDFLDACEPVRQNRNKRVGHNDLNTTIKPHENPLPGIGRKHIDRIVHLAEQILNVVYKRFVDGRLFFEPAHIGGADALIFWLKTAREYETTKRNVLLGNEA